jgi:hypothetical protein
MPRIPAASTMAPIRAKRETPEIPATRVMTVTAAAADDDDVDADRTMDRPRKAEEVHMEALMEIAVPATRVVAIGAAVPTTATTIVVHAVREKAILNRRAFPKLRLPFRAFWSSIPPRVTGFFATRRVSTSRSRPIRSCRAH